MLYLPLLGIDTTYREDWVGQDKVQLFAIVVEYIDMEIINSDWWFRKDPYNLLKGAMACCSRPTVCYLLGKAPPGVWACPSVSRAGLCRVCSGCLSAQRAVLTLWDPFPWPIGLSEAYWPNFGTWAGLLCPGECVLSVLLGATSGSIAFCA